ncbi:cation diffusion facilitator family transporter [candidate division KSB3 bacterium]|uniref:Cation diffusion facilitator family transporter n=1 Tax=candidate division KSB3 bacterium TaxID=2044937 RepID=A0A9D5JXI3_9BACT|nr:cation diffusion facilitator family transporter [candidate division KSB3 bacterium]MBD3325945.1 cation diffusion facilitator family transporter [candidate division KSB3 bacterium]
MAHAHHHPAPTSATRLFVTVVLNLLITIVQIVGGLLSGSLSLISDAFHNLSDGIAILISYGALKLSERPNTARYTFGLKRAEILAAVLNSGVLIGIGVFLFKEAYDRFVAPEPIAGGLMLVVAVVGLVPNVIGTLLLREGSKHNMNIRSAYLHLFADSVSSVAVILGGVAIYVWEVYWIDPLLTVLIGLYILLQSFDIVREAVNVLMMGTPEMVSLDRVRQEVEAIPRVHNIHHVHVWRMNEQDIYFEAHVDVEDMPVSETKEVSAAIEAKLHELYEIHHMTLQFECDACEQKGLVYDTHARSLIAEQET